MKLIKKIHVVTNHCIVITILIMLNVKKHFKVKSNGHIQKKMVYIVVHQIEDQLNR